MGPALNLSSNGSLPAGLTSDSTGLVNDATGQPMASPFPSTTSSSSPSPSSTGSSGPTAAQQAATAAAAALQAKIDSVISGGTASAIARGQGDTAAAAGNIGGLGDTLNTSTYQGQSAIDLARREIGTTQINTIKQLMNTIKQGLFGTGVQLGNTNALSSSARDAAGRAYADYGNRETNAANNQAATGNLAQDAQQKSLDVATANGLDYIAKQRNAAIGTIQANAQAALQQLAVSVAYLGGDASKVDIKGIQDQIIQNAQDQLATVDQTIQQHIASIVPTSREDLATAAEAASNAGVVPSSQTPFNSVNPAPPATTVPAGGAPPPSLIPLTLGKPQDQTPGV